MNDKQILACLIEWDDPMFEHNLGFVGRSCPPEHLQPNHTCCDRCNVCLLFATSKMREMTLDEYYKSFTDTPKEI